MSLIGCTTEIYVTNVVVRAKLEEGGGLRPDVGVRFLVTGKKGCYFNKKGEIK